jgi:hypothetical protein
MIQDTKRPVADCGVHEKESNRKKFEARTESRASLEVCVGEPR